MNVQIDYLLIGRRIRDYRRQAHLTQAELAERSGVCTQYIGSLERGQGIPSLGTVMSLCSALGIEPNALLLGTARDDPGAPSSLHNPPSIYGHTLTALLLETGVSDARLAALPDPAAFPSFDITLEDGVDSAESSPD